MRLPTLLACLAISSSLFVACRGDDDGNTPTDGGGGSNMGSGGTVKIQDVQNDAMPPGTAVALHSVVVTAIDTFGAKTGDIWVEEMGGGKRSGVHVYNAQLTDVAALTVGDVIDLKGAIKTEFALTGSNADNTGRTLTELEPASGGQIVITKLGQNSPITADKVDALAIGQMYDGSMAAQGGGTAYSNAWEDWEGVLVELDNVSALNASSCVGSKCTDPTAEEFDMTGVVTAESTLAAFPDDMNIKRGYCFANVTGVVDYFYDYLVLPRSASDVSNNGTACPAAESACADSTDNDGNGFTDCKDNGCIVGDATCRSATTIHDLDVAADTNPTAPTLPAAVGLTNSCVVAVSGTNLYIADAGTGAADGGLFVFGGGQPLPQGVVVGTTVDVIGTPSLFKQKSSTAPEPQVELAALQVTKDVAPCTVAPGLPAMTAAQLTADATGHKWIGSLVTITSANGGQFKITTAQSSTSKFGKLTQGSTVFSFGSSLLSTYDHNPVTTTCYDTITGIWTYDTTGAGSYEILPTVQPTAVTCT